jgi:enoyl-CoA hydratase
VSWNPGGQSKFRHPPHQHGIAAYRVSCSTLRTHDLVEGIRAQVVDKDRNPKWSPASLAAVNADDLEAFFAPIEDDLTLKERKCR